MKISQAEIYRVAMPLIQPWHTAYGEDRAIHSVLVKLSADGLEGWGEACPLYAPTYSAESALSVYETCREFFLPRVIGQEFETAAELMQSLDLFKGNYFAKAALETAWWSLECKRRNRPLWQLLGGCRTAIPCGEDLGVQSSIDELLLLVERSVARGYPRIKLKVKRDWDIKVLEAVRTAFPKITLHVDCNAAYDLHADWETLKSFDRFDLAMIEQPLADTDLHEHAALQQRIATPVCLDESVKSPRDFRLALELQACRAVNLKPGRVGGLHHAIQIHNMAWEGGITAWVGGMLESGVGASQCAALASLPGFDYPADIFPSGKFYANDLCATEIKLDARCALDIEGFQTAQFEPDLVRLDQMTLARAGVTDHVAKATGSPHESPVQQDAL
jgi:O-succinylbenzoate synthase